MTTFIKSKFVKAAVGLLALALVVTGFHKVANASYNLTMSLAMGSNNAQVMTLQQALNSNGFVVSTTGAGSPGHESTYFGAKTKAAVMAFQGAYNLPQVGRVGPLTRAAINALGGSTTTTTTTTGGLCPNGMTLASNCTMAPTGQTQQGTGPVTVSLATDNPASGYIVAGQATALLAKYTFNGSGTITSLTAMRTGLSQNSALTNVYLYKGATRLTDAASVNTNSVITFNGVNLNVNGSTTISVMADICSSTACTSVVGQTVGVTLTGYTVSGGTMTTASVAGNVMSISAGGILGSVNVNAANVGSSTVNVNAGLSQYIVWTETAQVNTNAVWLKSAAFHYVGSAPTDAMGNIGLFVDGTKVASSTGPNSLGYVVFDLTANPLMVATGSHTIDVRADLIKGSARTIQLTLQNAGDLMVTDAQVGVNIAAISNGSSTVFSPVSGNTISINQGTLSIQLDPAFTAMTTIISGGVNQVIGKYTVVAYGEDQKITTITLTPTFTGSPTTAPATSSLNNVELYYNGSQVGSACQYVATACTFNLGSSLIAAAGTTGHLEVRADMQNAANANYTAGTITVATATVTSGGEQGLSSLQTNASAITIPTTSGLGIQLGTVSMAKNPAYASNTMNANTPNAKIASFVIQNLSSSEAVRVTNLGVTIAYTTIGSTNLANLRTSETSGSGATPINPTTTAAGSSGTDNFSVNFTLAPGATKTLDIFADLGAATSGSTVTSLQLTALGAMSNVTVCAPSGLTGSQNGCNNGSTHLTGQTITIATGVFGTPAVVTSSSTVAQNVAGGTTTGTTDATKATFKFTATSGSAVISELGFKDSVAGGALTGVRVGSSSAIVASNKAYMQGLSIAVPQGGTGANIDAFASYAPVGAANGGVTTTTTGDITSLVNLSYVKYTIGGTTSTLCANGDSPTGGNCTASTSMPISSTQTMTLVGSKPTVTVAAPTGVSILPSTATEAIDVTISADQAGPITMVSFPINVALTGAGSSGTLTVATGGGNPFIVKDLNYSTNGLSATGSFSAGSGGAATVTLNSTTGYLLGAGQSQTFRVYIPVATVTSGGTSSWYNRISTYMPTGTGFVWADTAGGANANTASVTAAIFNYPNNTTVAVQQ